MNSRPPAETHDRHPAAIGLDVGTSSARAFAFDTAGRELGGAKIPYAWRTTPDGGIETDPELIVAAAVEAMDGVTARLAANGVQPVAVGIAALWHTLLGLDADRRPITPVYGWGDTRAAGAAARMRRELDGGELHARTGAALHPSYLPARLRWLADTAPDLVRRVRWWISAPEYLSLRLLGRLEVSYSMASGTGLLDQHTLDWDGETLDAAGITAEQLSTLVDRGSAAAPVARYAERWPTLKNLPWYPPLGDGACANVGSGCVSPRHLALSIGTSGALRLLDSAARITIPPRLWCYRLDRERALWGGAVSNGGNVHAWLRRTLRLPPPDELERYLATAPADGHGLTMLPFLAGERSPFFPLHARMTVAGITLDTPPEAIVQAGLEAVALRLSLIRDALRAHAPEAGTIVASGAALRRSTAWARILTDVMGEPIAVAPEEEASSRGAALLALQSVGELPDLPSYLAVEETLLEPDMERHARYRSARERQRALEERLGFC